MYALGNKKHQLLETIYHRKLYKCWNRSLGALSPSSQFGNALGQICAPASPSARYLTCSVRVSPYDNYSSNVELAIEALIRMKMSQLVSYQSISRESRFKQDIKDGRTVSSLFILSPPQIEASVRASLKNIPLQSDWR